MITPQFSQIDSRSASSGCSINIHYTNAPLNPPCNQLQNPGQVASLPGITALGVGNAVTAPGAVMPSVPTPAPAPAAAAPKPPVVGTPTFCLLVKNMFDPATETEDGWDLDIKEEMEEVGAVDD